MLWNKWMSPIHLDNDLLTDSLPQASAVTPAYDSAKMASSVPPGFQPIQSQDSMSNLMACIQDLSAQLQGPDKEGADPIQVR